MERAFSATKQETYIFEDYATSSSNIPSLIGSDSRSDEPQNLLEQMIQTASVATVTSSTTILAEPNFKEKVMQIIKELCIEHPDIEIDSDMLNGMPHIKGVRLSVGNVLEKLYLYGSIEKIKEIYGDDITEHQIKEAVAYAQDFLESACVPT